MQPFGPNPATPNALLTWLVDRESLVGTRNPIHETWYQFGLSNTSSGSSGTNDKAFVGDWSRAGFEQAAVARPNVGLGAVGIGDLNVGGTQVLLDTDRDGSAEYAFNVVLPGTTSVLENRALAGDFDHQFGDDIAITRTEFSGVVGYKHWYVISSEGSGDPFPTHTGDPATDATFSPHLIWSNRTSAHFSLGLAGDYELIGDITGDGLDEIIAVHPEGPKYRDGMCMPVRTNSCLQMEGDLSFSSFLFGSTAGIPVIGDWKQ